MGFNNLTPEMLDLIARAGGANVAAQTGVLNLGPGDVDPMQAQPTPLQAAGPTPAGTILEGVGQLGIELASPFTNLAAAAQSADPIGRFTQEFDPNLTLLDAFQEVGLPANVATAVLATIGEFGIPDPFGGFDDLLSFVRAARNVDDLAPLLGFVGRGGFGEGDFTKSIDTPARLQRAINDPQFEVGRRELVVQEVARSAEFDRAFNTLAEEGRQTAQEFIQGVMEGYRVGAFSADEAADMLGEIDTDLAEAFRLNNMLNEIPETLRQQIEAPFDPSFAEGVDARFEDLELQVGAAQRIAQEEEALAFERATEVFEGNPAIASIMEDDPSLSIDEAIEIASRQGVANEVGASFQALDQGVDLIDDLPGSDQAQRLLTFEMQGGDVANFLGAVASSGELTDLDPQGLRLLAAEVGKHSTTVGPPTGMDLIDMMARIPFISNEQATRILRIGGMGVFPSLE